MCWCVRWYFKENQALINITVSNERKAVAFKVDKYDKVEKIGLENTSVTDANIPISKMSHWYAFTTIRFFRFYIIRIRFSTIGDVRIFTPAQFFCPKQKLYIFWNFRAIDFFWDMCPIFLSHFLQVTDRNRMTP